MKRFFALFQIPASVMEDWKKNTKPEDMKAAGEKMMREWEKWTKAHEKSLVERGAPLGKTKRVTAGGIAGGTINFRGSATAANGTFTTNSGTVSGATCAASDTTSKW